MWQPPRATADRGAAAGAGAPIARRDRYGVTPLESAVRGRHLEVAELLLEGAKPAALGGLSAKPR